MNCEDCVYSDIADWEQNKKNRKSKGGVLVRKTQKAVQ